MTQLPHTIREAPGRPGGPPRWSTGRKAGLGTARSETTLVWFTLSNGAFTEIFYPRIDSPCLRDAYLIVTACDGFFSDERRHATHSVQWVEDGVPAFDITTSCVEGRYRIEKTFLTDNRLNAALQRVRFTVLRGRPEDYKLFIYANPHIAGEGGGNTAWVEDFKGRTMLFANRGDIALALACSIPYRATSVGFTEKSDGIEQLKTYGRLSEVYLHAESGNVGVIGELDLTAPEILLSFGFGFGASEAAHHALGSMLRDFEEIRSTYVERWKEWQNSLSLLRAPRGRDLYRQSTAALLASTNKSIPGAIASLAVPWGNDRGDDDFSQGAYHMVWPRDLVNCAGGMLAAGEKDQAKHLLDYLCTTQEAEGHWPQNMWVSGEASWTGIQTDQIAQPILLVDLARKEGAVGESERKRLWAMMRKAAQYLVANGPSSELDRWEDARGLNAYSLGSMIAALLIAAEWGDAAGERGPPHRSERSLTDGTRGSKGGSTSEIPRLHERSGSKGITQESFKPKSCFRRRRHNPM